jgi:hypothetical protein
MWPFWTFDEINAHFDSVFMSASIIGLIIGSLIGTAGSFSECWELRSDKMHPIVFGLWFVVAFGGSVVIGTICGGIVGWIVGVAVGMTLFYGGAILAVIAVCATVVYSLFGRRASH